MARPARRLGNLPAETTSFIGRKADLSELRKKLGEARLVTVVGPGGVGKSRFAIRGATELSRGFSDGVWWVELAELRDARLVPNAVMGALDLRDQAATAPLELLLVHLRDKKLLLVLDNCEHLLPPAASLVEHILSAAPGVRVIATSREPLAIPGEHLMPLSPLELPSAPSDPLDQLRQNEAVMLFIERAVAARGEFELSPTNQAAVVELCRRLDGLPLAIELAAVRTRALGVAQIVERLTDRFALLTGGTRAALPRHQTLETTIEWSHDLLNPSERAIFRRLCVFAGRFTLADVEAVVSSTDLPARRVLDLLSGLVDRSLVGKEEIKDIACYRLHETIREYARLKLRDEGEEEAVEDRLVEHYRGIGLRAMPDARFHLLERLSWLELEIDNIRAVLRRCVERADFTRGIDITQGAAWYWITHATTEGLRWLEELLPHGRGSPQAAGWAYFLRGFLSLLKADAAKARTGFLEAASYARDAGQAALLSQALAMAAVTAMMTWDLQAARRVLEEAHAVRTDLDDVAVKVGLFQARSLIGLMRGDLDEVRAASSAGVELSREANDLYALQMMLTNLGLAAFLSADLDQAKPRFIEAMGVARKLDDRVALYYVLTMLGCHAASSGQHRLAAQLIGAADSVRITAGANPLPILPPLIAEAEQTAVAALGKAKFDAEMEKGRRLTRNAAIALALDERQQASPASSGLNGSPDGLLGKREAEVAQLVGEGLSNKQIGARLFISERTVDSHVRSILNKLGVNSRAQIARWVEAHGSWRRTLRG